MGAWRRGLCDGDLAVFHFRCHVDRHAVRDGGKESASAAIPWPTMSSLAHKNSMSGGPDTTRYCSDKALSMVAAGWVGQRSCNNPQSDCHMKWGRSGNTTE